ncbi:hypothetical protein V501_10013 [Pseudogymnoascus sp. VKM F-4519 (FW-2642)]|nr:hypothetical protein V501_10013 [Pseudogymnoascus sp. VKM F-4519 (FW-2642)]
MEHSDETVLPLGQPRKQLIPARRDCRTTTRATEASIQNSLLSSNESRRRERSARIHGKLAHERSRRKEHTTPWLHHGLFRDINEPISFNALVVMRKSIDYRMNQVMGAATMYKNFWDIDIPDCHQLDVDSGGWSSEAFRWACGYALFDEPGSLQGHRYVKGSMYMAYCITEAGWDQAEAEAKLDTLVQYKEAGVFGSGISNIEGTSRIRAMIPRIMSSYERPIREELEKIAQYMKLRVQMVSSTQSLREEASEESLAWPLSGTTQERECGSPFIMTLADTLLRLPMEGYNTGEVDYDDKSPTYAGLIKVIRDAIHEVDLRKENVGAENTVSIHQPMFSSDHDESEMEYGERTGLALNMVESRPEPPGGEHQFGPGEEVLSHDQLKLAVKKEAQRCLDSEPGIDSAANNIGLQGAISRLLKNTSDPDTEDLVEMRESIGYRMNQIMRTATRYKNEWGLNIQDCHFADMDSFINRGLQNQANMWSLVCKYPLFDEPTYLQGRPYVKGKKYITRCILEAGWNPDEAADKLDRLVKYKSKQGLAALSSGVTEVESTNNVMATLRLRPENRRTWCFTSGTPLFLGVPTRSLRAERRSPPLVHSIIREKQCWARYGITLQLRSHRCWSGLLAPGVAEGDIVDYAIYIFRPLAANVPNAYAVRGLAEPPNLPPPGQNSQTQRPRPRIYPLLCERACPYPSPPLGERRSIAVDLYNAHIVNAKLEEVLGRACCRLPAMKRLYDEEAIRAPPRS